MHLHKKILTVVLFAVAAVHLYAFDSGFTLGVKANLTGSLTRPKINKEDRDYLGADKMEGSLGYITVGEADLTYIFDSIKYFRLQDNSIFGGLGWSFALGLGQGFTGQISGQADAGIGVPVNVYCRIHMTPVLTLTTGVRSYFLGNRIAVGLNTGIRMPMDPQPIYELYSNLTPEQIEALKTATGGKVDFSPETGTLLITPEQIKKINPIGFTFKGYFEYNQPFLSRMEILFGAFLSYTVYRPKYITMPQKVITAAQAGGAAKNPPINVDVLNHPLNSYYLNSLDFGLTIGLTFKV
ncbi:hypothetical protein [Treponema sp. OMZ 857]|uniref:hypothetical protein n=1 Tax=Treponema sp. OMZ 857 TaxID=1643513 RepID=UPI0020A498B7|nr:hypothetical protein [Treponema sp. OMZ 857]UTC42873.1 hypothetical protein E4N66_01320 [Treponema sp. OMZ 857]